MPKNLSQTIFKMGIQAIRVENIGKRYMISHHGKNKGESLLTAITGGVTELLKQRRNEYSEEEFWALKDISFNVEQGERVGIIGRNGAGKSTLLKILSGIVKPTKGIVEYNGKMASLLEVGTGFHGDLSGRENIFLNGSILGMTKREIEARFDEIVSFSEVEQFIDTPVKRYSSGMYVKLAFAVAAHMSPDILILDEVLAVGDAAFQKKCINKMNELSTAHGRTVLFVSHSMSMIRSMCTSGVYLEHGNVLGVGPIDKVIAQYQDFYKENIANGIAVKVRHLAASGEWEIDTDIEVEVSWEKGRFAPGWQCDLACYTVDGIKVFALQSHLYKNFNSMEPDFNGVVFRIRNVGFINSELKMDVGIRNHVDEPYTIVIEGCAILSPSDKNLPGYARHDVIVVPASVCNPTTI